MALDNPKKPTGKIYLGVANETTIEGLDAMQASIRREDWNKNTQELYLYRIREKATEKAKQILGAAYTERQKIIDDAHLEAKKIKDEAEQILSQAKQHDEQSSHLHEEAQRKFDASEENGFDSGLSQAVDEITAFRIEIGSSLIAIIEAIEKQSAYIFEQWREDIIDLVRICIEKSTDWTIKNEHHEIIKSLVMNAAKQLLDRRQINVCVHPDDEETVAQLFNFAKEAMPDIKHWAVSSDPNMQQGDLVMECPLNVLHNKREHRVAMVENILNNLTLPSEATDGHTLAKVHESVEEQVQNINELVPEIKAQIEAQADNVQAESALPENENTENQNAENISADNNAQDSAEVENNLGLDQFLDTVENQEDITENNEQNNAHVDTPPQAIAELDQTNNVASDQDASDQAASDHDTGDQAENTPIPPVQENSPESEQDAANKLMEDLEQELLPLPEHMSSDFDNTSDVSQPDSVFATGGFLTAPDKANT